MAVELAPELLEILACPNCHGSLAVDHEREELVCLDADCGLAYPVRSGIPVLLIDEARRPQASHGSSAGSGEPRPAPPADAS
ncbi:MAG TPA: Trm112 family protein [Propionibacteriaceae bacterium]|nr:Trm112 family protein [Propionibacteriaceae bacterium]